MDLREIGWDGMDWIDLAQDRDHLRTDRKENIHLTVIIAKQQPQNGPHRKHVTRCLPCLSLATAVNTWHNIMTHDARFCRETLEVCYSNLQMFNVGTLSHTAYINAVVEFLPSMC
jgi:hypothetical protein